MSEIVTVALATWALAWALSFWHKTERLREWLGVYLVYGAGGEPIDREDEGGLGGWLNCPMCAAALALPVSVLLYHSLRPLAVWLAALGLALLVVRWWEGTREKARWWT